MKKKLTLENIHIYWVLGAIFFLRVLIVFAIGNPADINGWTNWISKPDTQSYVEFSEALYNNTWDFYPPRLPGYPLVLILTRTLFSPEWLGTILFQQFIALCSALLLYRAGQKYTKKFAYLVPIIFLFEPFTLIFSYALLPEVFMVFIQIASFSLIMQGQSAQGRKRMLLVALSSLVLCAGVFFKPILLYSFFLFIPYIFIFYIDTWIKRTMLALLFIGVFQLPIHLYRTYIGQRFQVYSLTKQEFSEKAGRAIDIKYLAEQKHLIHPDSIRAEIRATLMKSGYDYDHPDNRLYAHVTDSIAKVNVRKYAPEVLYYSFSESYMFFQPSSNSLFQFLRLKPLDRLPETGLMKERIIYTIKRFSHIGFIGVLIISVAYSFFLLVPMFIAFGTKALRARVAPLLYWSIAWFVYSSVLVGRIAQARYRLTFIWMFVLVAGLVFSYLLEHRIFSKITEKVRGALHRSRRTQ